MRSFKSTIMSLVVAALVAVSAQPAVAAPINVTPTNTSRCGSVVIGGQSLPSFSACFNRPSARKLAKSFQRSQRLLDNWLQ